MKLFGLIFTTFISFASVKGQDTSSVKLIESIIRLKQDTATIYYYDSVATSYRVQDIKAILSNRIIRNLWKDNNQNNSITLTKAEQKYIFNQLDEFHKMVWGKNLFVNSVRVLRDSSQEILRQFDNTNRKNYNPKAGRQIWEFTQPIFLRENTICLTYTLYICGGLCGRDELCFYKKINRRWSKWITISSGVF